MMEVSWSGFYDYLDSLEGSDDLGEVALKARIAATQGTSGPIRHQLLYLKI